MLYARQLAPKEAKLLGGAIGRLTNRPVQWQARFHVQFEEPMRIHVLVEQRRQCSKVFLTHAPPPRRLPEHARDHPRVDVNQRSAAGTDDLRFRPDPPFRPPHPLATPALTRESHDGLPDPVCITGFGANHRRVERSCANLRRTSRPKGASRSPQRAETKPPKQIKTYGTDAPLIGVPLCPRLTIASCPRAELQFSAKSRVEQQRRPSGFARPEVFKQRELHWPSCPCLWLQRRLLRLKDKAS
jgi:hypothetical protein